MFKAFFTACILFTASFLFAVQPQKTAQERFDELATHKSFGEPERQELRDLMALEKESGDKIDCTFCPDRLTWYLATNDFFDETTWLLDHNADYGIKDKDGMSLLHVACRRGHKDFVEQLIGRGAEINLPDKAGRIALHYAVMSGNEQLVESLLKLGSDPNKLTINKETPLHFAAKYSGLAEVKFLVENGACIKAINWALVENLKEQRRRQDRLYFDSDEEHVIALKTALGLKTPESIGEEEEEEEEEDDDEDEDYGGERYADTMDDVLRADAHAKKNVSKQILFDLDNIPVNLLPRDVGDAVDKDGMTALLFAANNGNTEVIRYLLENGADIKAHDTRLERSAIHFAVESGNLECVKFLSEHGANMLDRDIYGATALHYAAEKNNLEVIKYLVSKKMDYTAKDARGWTAMHYAACGGSIDVIRYFLAKGLNINELNQSGRTPLFFARGNHELRKFMIRNGAQ